ncbi:hypothetical protein N658DRAFT_36323 [Parathielavia hyrcaniae]|uniref:Uncharacterized protein n=1 Tax=Parathielavia hyrcaniae TaxID=113614 RepID=A0AAN6QB59_9PEZI|nr:hypothetical protein N658DRAFT_36323 [Parathielavia hyrcaniae]
MTSISLFGGSMNHHFDCRVQAEPFPSCATPTTNSNTFSDALSLQIPVAKPALFPHRHHSKTRCEQTEPINAVVCTQGFEPGVCPIALRCNLGVSGLKPLRATLTRCHFKRAAQPKHASGRERCGWSITSACCLASIDWDSKGTVTNSGLRGQECRRPRATGSSLQPAVQGRKPVRAIQRLWSECFQQHSRHEEPWLRAPYPSSHMPRPPAPRIVSRFRHHMRFPDIGTWRP